jgi:hypothetical protein
MMATLMTSENTALAARSQVERMTGIEPALSAWEADVLPLNYIRRVASGVPARGLANTSYRNGALAWAILDDQVQPRGDDHSPRAHTAVNPPGASDRRRSSLPSFGRESPAKCQWGS